jgi:hypothetical protein
MRMSKTVGVGVMLVVLSSVARTASADALVIGTGNPVVDVAAVQAAVDAGGVVTLQGTFSFDVPPVDDRTILVTTGVVVEGIPDANGNMPVITGGVKPFQVNAPGQPVRFRALRFVGAKLTVIEVRAAEDVAVEYCRFEQVEPLFASAIGANLAIGVVLGFFTAGQVVGDISIAHNHFAIGGTASDRTEAIAAIGVGRADTPVRLTVADNVVTNTVAHGIDIRNIVGQASIERNDVSTGAIGGQMVPFGDRFVDGIRVLGSGSYLVAHNRVRVGYENAAGIRLQGGPTAPVAQAIVFGNDITMDSPDPAVFGSESTGIELRRAAAGNTLLSNRIRGHAQAAIALIAEPAGAPRDTTVSGNNYASFAASLADLYIAPGVIETTVIGGQGTVLDQGAGTVLKGSYVTP